MKDQKYVWVLILLWTVLLCGAQERIPDDAYQSHLRAGAEEIARGDFSAAVADIRAAIALNPDGAAGWYQFGSILGQAGDFQGAEKAFRKAIALQPDLAKAHFGLALTLIGDPQNKQDWPGAITECREALKFQPDYPEALNLLGAGLSKSGQTDAAIEALERSIQLAPTLPQAHFNLAIALEDKGRLDEATKEYRAAVSAKGAYPEASSALAKLLLRMGKTADAESEVKAALRANPDLADAHYTLARILRSAHRDREAAVEFAEVKELNERQSNGVQSSQMSNKGLELAAKGDLTGAASVLREAIALKPDYGVPHYNLGLVLADNGETAAAEQELTKAISLLPGQAKPWFELGRVLRRAKNDVGAWEVIAWAAHMAPSDSAIQSELASLRTSPTLVGSTHTTTLVRPRIGAQSDTAQAHFAFAGELSARGDLGGAVGELLRSLALQPAMMESRRSLATTYVSLGKNDQAVLEYYKLLLASPEEAALRIALGKILLAQGNAQDAADQLRQALAYQPGSQEARTLLIRADHFPNKQ